MSGHTGKDEPLLLERRAFLKMGTAGMGLLLMGWANPVRAAILADQSGNPTVKPRGSARNCLLVVLRGGQSHVDTFDIKTGSWTPQSFDVQKLAVGYSWPMGLMPGLAQRTDKFSLVRSLQHQEVVHERAQYYVETGRRLNPGLRSEIPNIGAVIALESQAGRLSTDIFPASMMFNYGSYTNNGFLSADYAPFMAPIVCESHKISAILLINSPHPFLCIFVFVVCCPRFVVSFSIPLLPSVKVRPGQIASKIVRHFWVQYPIERPILLG